MYMYIEYMALNNLQWLIYHKIQPKPNQTQSNQIKPNQTKPNQTKLNQANTLCLSFHFIIATEMAAVIAVAAGQ